MSASEETTADAGTPHGTLEVIDLQQRFGQFDDAWNPRVVAELNGQQVKVAKLRGDFVWHHHRDEDELFWVISGVLEMGVRKPLPGGEVEETVDVIGPGQIYVVPRGVDHRPVARDEVQLVMFEPATTLNTGNADDDRRVDELEKL